MNVIHKILALLCNIWFVGNPSLDLQAGRIRNLKWVAVGTLSQPQIQVTYGPPSLACWPIVCDYDAPTFDYGAPHF